MCSLALACSASLGTAQTAATTLVEAPQPVLQASLASGSFQDYIQSHPLNINPFNLKLLEPPRKNNRPILGNMLASATLPGTVIFSFNGITGALDQFGISYHNHQTGTGYGKGFRVDPTKFIARVFPLHRRRK